MKLSLVIPTYNEKENIQKLIKKIQEEFKKNKINGEIIIVDDNSPDGTGKILEDLKKKQKNLKIIHRSGKLGLSSAVLEGWKIAEGEILGVMDADLSHPPEKIKELYNAIEKGKADFVIGSRYVRGGKIEGWNFKRKIMSKTATLLSRIYTKVKDPMSGFFMIKKEVIKNVDLNPKGFKILLEIIVKGKYSHIQEIPIFFVNRKEGKSKAGAKEIIFYLQNLFSYLPYKRKLTKQLFKFYFVGAIGAIINLLILYFLTEKAGFFYIVSAFFSFVIAMSCNFILNKVYTFKESIKIKFVKKYLQFTLISIFALFVNLIFLFIFTEFFKFYYLFSQILAIGIASLLNFSGNKLWIFKNE